MQIAHNSDSSLWPGLAMEEYKQKFQGHTGYFCETQYDMFHIEGPFPSIVAIFYSKYYAVSYLAHFLKAYIFQVSLIMVAYNHLTGLVDWTKICSLMTAHHPVRLNLQPFPFRSFSTINIQQLDDNTDTAWNDSYRLLDYA